LTHSGFETKQRIRNLNCSWRRRWLAYIQIRYSSSTHLWELLAHCFRSPLPSEKRVELSATRLRIDLVLLFDRLHGAILVPGGRGVVILNFRSNPRWPLPPKLIIFKSQ